eukprot:GILI01026540.1.p1 GENE.GILI01026540.1~~GILI01026540.1.p1  ORF type:complete len:181 (-),score=36.18 GILI01026540.1:51-593(-)
MTGIVPFDVLQQLPREQFFEVINVLFETAPPLADRLYEQRSSLTSYFHLIDKSDEIIRQLPLHDKIEVINAHPRIGAPAANLSALSYKEQGLHLQQTDREKEEQQRVLAELAQLNDAYEAKFGFKFVVFVNGRPRSAIIPIIRERMERSAEEELETGLSEMTAIARDRLKKLLPEISSSL